MRVIEELEELRQVRRSLKGSFGLVPTMGSLHAGHLSLVEAAQQQNDCIGASIFINPTQFSPGEDLASYPRQREKDLELLERAGVELVWIPNEGTVYPSGFRTWIEVEGMRELLEGARRPGHFRGVATVVAKLFLAFEPDRAYFGQKDAQQCRVIQQMVRDLNFAVEVVVCPTVRDEDGLALSSRNAYLSPAEREAAPVLYRSLRLAYSAFEKGERRAERLRTLIAEELKDEPLARVEYISVANPESLEEVDQIDGGALISLAVFFGRARLIDNILLSG